MKRRDWITELGIGLVGAAAAVLTFTTLRDLGESVGIRGWLAWLVPITVDAAGVVAARVWLRRQAPPEAVEFGRLLAWACIGASVAGNAGQHYMAAELVRPAWWVVVLVSAVPPAMLGAVVHLGHLTRRTAEAGEAHTVPSEVTEEAPTDPSPMQEEDPEEIVEPDPARWWASAPPAGDTVGEPGEPAGDQRVAELVASGLGRRRLAKELGIKEHEARALLAQHRAEVAA